MATRATAESQTQIIDLRDPPHKIFAQCVMEFVPALVIGLGVAFLGLIGTVVIQVFQIQLAFAMIMIGGLLVFRIAFGTFLKARQVIANIYDEWVEERIAARELADKKLALELNIKGNNNTVSVGATTNQAVIVSSPDNERLVKHFREWVQRAAFIKKQRDGEGIERRHYLRCDGAVRDYQFVCDGTTITRPEYEMFIEMLRATGQVPDRKQGTPGHVPKMIELAAVSQPTQPNPTNVPSGAVG